MNNISPPRHIIIVGGGTAGWMTACLMAHQWRKLGIKLTLIESSKIGTVGVGEGSTPFLKEFFETLGIEESTWMPECNATYKCGIRFPDWSIERNHTSYFHPFYSDIDGESARVFFQNANTRRKRTAIHANPDEFFVTSALADAVKAPKYHTDNSQDLSYGYHFDAELLGRFLKKHAQSLGVNHIDDRVTQAIVNKEGNIALVNTEKHGPLRGDFFVDCSGFKGLLIQETLGEALISFEGNLFNDSAVAIPTPHQYNDSIPSETISKALKNGWVWHIPLTSRMGNGYVYSAKYCSKEEAEAELRALLGESAENQPALHLHWTPGRITNHWKKNCVAIGLSQGFLEPLEAPMLYLIQRSIEGFIENFSQNGFTDAKRDVFNSEINNIIDGTRDYLQAHYKINSRTDTAYWRDSRDNNDMSPILNDMLNGWLHEENFDEVINANMANLSYLKTSWYCLLAGKGFFLPLEQGQNDDHISPEHLRIKALVASKANEFYDHKQYLDMLFDPAFLKTI